MDEDAVRRALAPFVLTGTEAHEVVNDLVEAMLGADANSVLVLAARATALRRLHALLKNTVPLEAVLDVLERLQSQQTTSFDFSEVLRGFVEQQLRYRAEENQSAKGDTDGTRNRSAKGDTDDTTRKIE